IESGPEVFHVGAVVKVASCWPLTYSRSWCARTSFANARWVHTPACGTDVDSRCADGEPSTSDSGRSAAHRPAVLSYPSANPLTRLPACDTAICHPVVPDSFTQTATVYAWSVRSTGPVVVAQLGAPPRCSA